MEIDYSPYDFEKVDSEENIYLFDTDFELSYEIIFKHTPYLFSSDKPYSDDTYEFSIIVIENPNHASPPFDNRIGSTIARIFDEFYKKNGNTVSLYICASHDNRQKVRYRKFNSWFATFNSSKYVKIDASITDLSKNEFPISIIVSSDNPYKKSISSDFYDVIDNFQNNK
jgi:hypothetical protein